MKQIQHQLAKLKIPVRLWTGAPFSLNQLLVNKGRKFIEDEIKKCDLLCANCHRETHIENKTIGVKKNF